MAHPNIEERRALVAERIRSGQSLSVYAINEIAAQFSCSYGAVYADIKALTAPYPRFYVYALSDPRTGIVRYIGATKNPNRRLQLHHTGTDGRAAHTWFAELRSLGMTATMAILFETEDREEVGRQESAEVSKHLAAGCPLLNTRLSSFYPF